MSLSIKKAGFLTTIQDLGRRNFRKFGINPNGAMDKTALRLINALLENTENEAVLEMHFPAPEIKFEDLAIFALGGANFPAKLNEEPINNWQIHLAKKNDVLKFSQRKQGYRCYLSVLGGFKIKEWLESSSTNLAAKIGGFEGRKLQKADNISFKSKSKTQNIKEKTKIARSIIPNYSKFPTVRVIPGFEYVELTGLSELNFLSQSFTISTDSNRMGFRLFGKPLYRITDLEILSDAVNFGTVQLLPDGQLIILMADHQTTGGYPRIAHIIERDLPLIAQLGANDKVKFELVSLETAENLLLEFEKDLRFLKFGIRSKKY